MVKAIVRKLTGLGALALGVLASAAHAEPTTTVDPAWKVSADYTADVSGPVAGGRSHAGRYLDNLLATVDGDLGKAMGLSGVTVHAAVLNNAGGQPNDLAGTLQGVDNIEVARPRGRLFEAWIEQAFDKGSIRAGLYDLNSEFYQTDSASLFIAPAFGIGSELAATGPNGPSIFPSTALAVRLRLEPAKDTYLQGAVINAHAGVVGDPGGVDTGFGDGALVIGEAGWTGRGKVALGAWRYGRRQEAFADLTLSGDTATRVAQGAYLLVDQPVHGAEGDVRKTSAFLRLGVSDGQTTPFRGGGQAGLRVSHVFNSRPDSEFAIGVNRGRLSSDFRSALEADGVRAADAESAVEVTYADRVSKRVTLQPSVQYVLDPGGDREARDAVVLTLRARIHLI